MPRLCGPDENLYLLCKQGPCGQVCEPQEVSPELQRASTFWAVAVVGVLLGQSQGGGGP